MTNDDQRVPSEDEMRHAYWLTRMLDHHAAVTAAFDRFLARVRRDAARDAVEDADYWQARAYEAEGKLWKAEERIAEEKHLRMKATAAATKAEARIKAVEDVLDDLEQQSPDQIGWDAAGLLPVLRRALESVPQPRA